MNSSLIAKRVLGPIAEAEGVAAGAASRAQELLADVVSGGQEVGQLLGDQEARRAAMSKLADVVAGVGQYAQNVFADPGRLVRDAAEAGQNLSKDLVPQASPMADTVAGEMHRNFDIGRRQGGILLDMGAMAAPSLAAAEAPSALTQDERTLNYMNDFPPRAAARLAEPYDGMGHHFIARAFTFPADINGLPLPSGIAGQPLPRWISDSPLNVLKPQGMDRGEFYALHYQVDPSFYGARLPGGGGWSGQRLGLQKYGPLGRAVYGSPTQLKAFVLGPPAAAGAAAAAGSSLQEGDEDDRTQGSDVPGRFPR